MLFITLSGDIEQESILKDVQVIQQNTLIPGMPGDSSDELHNVVYRKDGRTFLAMYYTLANDTKEYIVFNKDITDRL